MKNHLLIRTTKHIGCYFEVDAQYEQKVKNSSFESV